jgi:hypothetical protein
MLERQNARPLKDLDALRRHKRAELVDSVRAYSMTVETRDDVVKSVRDGVLEDPESNCP